MNLVWVKAGFFLSLHSCATLARKKGLWLLTIATVVYHVVLKIKFDMKNRINVLIKLYFRGLKLVKLEVAKWDIWSKSDTLKLRKEGYLSQRTYQIFVNICRDIGRKLSYVKEQELKALEDENETEGSEGDTSKKKARSPYLPRKLDTDVGGAKTFCGTPLRLIPNIRDTDIDLGEGHEILEAFGIKRRTGTVVTLFQGPNRRLNRYLAYQYKRLILSIGGSIHTRTELVKEFDRIKKTRYVKWATVMTKVDMAKWKKKEKKVFRFKIRKFWNIGLNLLLNSAAFRITLFLKVLGKSGRWFHRDVNLVELVQYNKEYLKIAKHFKNSMPLFRTWIPEQFKWRPLGSSTVSWRIYTGGFVQLLYVFMLNSWPKHQHGYTNGRGVHTAWKFILRTVIKSKFIFEFDFIGYFNNISHRSVTRSLDRFQVPKYIIMYVMELSSGPVQPPKLKDFLENLEAEPPTFALDWYKHEYMQKYRKGYRPRGFPQGGSLSPLLSILPVLLDAELERLEIGIVSYCDDGILYGDKMNNFLELLQSLLDDKDTGVKCHLDKSGWVKKDNVWLKPLKFVGLLYEPFEDILSACTRKGSRLPMKIDLVGLRSRTAFVSKDVMVESTRCEWAKPDLEGCPWDDAMFGFWTPGLRKYYDLIPLEQARIEFHKWHFWKILKWIVDSDSQYVTLNLSERVIANDSGLWFYFKNVERLDRQEANSMLEDLSTFFPILHGWHKTKELAFKNMQDSMYIGPFSKGQDLEEWGDHSVRIEGAVDLLVWYRRMLKLSIRTLVDNGVDIGINDMSFEEGRLFKLDPLNALAVDLPTDALKKAVEHNWDVALTLSRICWHNMVDGRYFGTLISRLFIGSFEGVKVVQNFKLSYEPRSLTSVMNSVVGRREWASFLHSGNRGLTVFNSTTIAPACILCDAPLISINLLRQLLKKKHFSISTVKICRQYLMKRNGNQKNEVKFLGSLNIEIQFIVPSNMSDKVYSYGNVFFFSTYKNSMYSVNRSIGSLVKHN
jgi:hypothetical protein